MRLLFVHDRFGAMGGAEVNAWLTAGELQGRGHSLGILHGAATGQGEAEWRDVFPERFALAHGRDDTAAALRTFDPEAVYVHKMSDLRVLQSLVESGVPLVRMVHDHDLYCLRSYKYFPLTRRICTRPAGLRCIVPCGGVLARNRGGRIPFKWMSYLAKQREIRLNRRFHRLVVATDYMKSELLRNGFDSRRIEIHAPVPKNTDAPFESSFTDRNLILYAGQIIRGKGVDVLLESLALVRVPFECLIAGDGSHRAHCEALALRLGLGDRVRFKGYLPPAELQAEYRDASLAVMSSVWPEPFGAAGLEAMRYGLPVVAFDAGGIREWLIDGQNGFLVPWMNRARFAERVERLLTDKTLARRMGRQGRDFAREKFGFGKYVDGLEAMFGRVIAEAAVTTNKR